MPFDLPLRTADHMAVFLLVFFRITGVLLSAPLLSGVALPVQLRIYLGLGAALLCFPAVSKLGRPGAAMELLSDGTVATIVIFSEVATGWLLGMVASISLWGAQLAGHIVGQELGLSLGDVFDPISESIGSPTTSLFYTVMLLVFVLLGGHQLLFVAVVGSFSAAPPGAFLDCGAGTTLYVARDLGGEIWRQGVMIALPAVFGLGLVTVALAILARAAPEMNIFVFGFALRVAVGLLGLAIIIPFIIEAFAGTVAATDGFLEALLHGWRSS